MTQEDNAAIKAMQDKLFSSLVRASQLYDCNYKLGTDNRNGQVGCVLQDGKGDETV